MHRHRLPLVLPSALLLAVAPVPAQPTLGAGTVPIPAGCRDLSAEPVRGRIGYYTEVQPIFDGLCGGCHTGGSAFGGLALDEAVSWQQLVGVPASSVTLDRVDPFAPSNSWLFLKVNCEDPGDGSARMPLNGVPRYLDAAEQALIRDWIAAGARPSLFVDSFEAQL